MPFVCASMLSGAGYAPPPLGAPSGSVLHKVPREVYLEILDELLANATFCEGVADIELLERTKATMLEEPPPLDLPAAAHESAAAPSQEKSVAATMLQARQRGKLARQATARLVNDTTTGDPAEAAAATEFGLEMARKLTKHVIDMAGTGGGDAQGDAPEEPANVSPRVQAAFDSMDRNRDGTLAVSEVSKGLKALGVEVAPEGMSSVFAAFDENGSFRIDVREFSEMYNMYNLQWRGSGVEDREA